MKNTTIACRTAAVAALLLGLAGLAGWLFGIETLKRLAHGWVAMQANTAALLAICGAALLLICAGPGTPHYALKKRAAFFLAALTVLTGLLTILEYVYGSDFGLDQILFIDDGAAFAAYPGRMAASTALCFILTGLGILLADLRIKNWTFSASEKLAVAVLLIAFHSLISYLYVVASGTVSNQAIPMAPHTGAAFMFLGVGLILARPGGFVSILSGRGISRTLVLLTLPTAFFVPAAFAWLRLLAEKRGFHDGTSGVALASVVSGAVLITVTLYAVKVVRKINEDLHITQFSVDNAVDAVLWSGPDGRILYANKAAGDMLGYTSEEMLGLSVIDVSANYKMESWTAQWTALKDKGSLKYETEFRTRAGSLTPVEINSRYISQYGREYKCVYARDLTESRQTQRTLRESELKFRTLVESLPQKIFMKDRDYKWIMINGNMARDLGIRPEEIVGKTDADLFTPELAAKYHGDDVRVMKTGKTESLEEKYLNEGKEIWVNTVKTPVRSADGRITGLLGIFWDISERKRVEEELQKAKAGAEAANLAKRDFLSKMSHAIRTPMNAILGFTQLMRRDPGATGPQIQRLDIINRSGEHLLELINEVLDISRIESGRLALNKAAFDLHSMLEELKKTFMAKAEEKNLRLELEILKGVPRFFSGDSGKLRQVISNIISNAVKFTERGGVSLRVRAEGLGGGKFRLEAEVEDSGPGMTPEEAAELFKPFKQTQVGRKDGTGTGLGLAISREYSRLMGGGVEVVTSQPGEGSTFKVSVIMEEAGQADIVTAPASRHVKSLEQGQPPCRVLIVDEKEDDQLFLSELLGMLGFEARSVSGGAQALKEFEAWLPQVILMDLHMPGMDGHEAIKRLRSMEKGKEVKIIAISASAFTEVQQAAMASGADEFIAKPFRENELFEKIGKLTGVQYIYEDQPAPAPGGVEEPLTAALFAGCPAELLVRIRGAALACDFDAITGLADQVEPVNLKAARGLRALAQKYDSKSILKAVPAGKP